VGGKRDEGETAEEAEGVEGKGVWVRRLTRSATESRSSRGEDLQDRSVKHDLMHVRCNKLDHGISRERATLEESDLLSAVEGGI